MITLKQPSEKLAFGYDFAAKLGAETIAAILSVVSEPRGAGANLVNEGQANTTTAVNATWSGGADGESYLTTVKIRDSAAQEHELEREILVLDGRWVMPDGGAPYLTIVEFVDKFGLEEIVRLTDTAGDGRIDKKMLVAALTDVQSIADAYIAAVYTVPLASVPAIVKTAIADMTRARLYRQGVPDGVDAAAKAAMKILERISEGKLPVPSLTALTPATSPAPVKVSEGTRQYPDGLADY